MKQPIPDAGLDDRLGFVGTAGSGKSYNAMGRVERLREKGARVACVDPLGVFWGLRLKADGKTASGFDIPIFGGPHGDLPLTELSGALIGVLFFLSVVVLLPFTVGPDLKLLARLGPAILWLGALLASLLTLDRLFMADHDDGSLDLIMMSRNSLELACAAKALAHWIAAGLPLIVATPVLGLLLNLDIRSTLVNISSCRLVLISPYNRRFSGLPLWNDR